MSLGKIIAIVGVPSTGKTTLGKSLEKTFSLPFLEEDWQAITFFSNTRKQKPTNFEICIGFLNLRYTQIQKAAKMTKNEKCVFVDTIFEMTDVYAKPVLDADEYTEFKKVYEIYRAAVPRPDFYVHLTGDMQTIQRRALDRTLKIKNEEVYLKLEALQASEQEIVKLLEDVGSEKVLVIDVTQEDIRTDDFLKTFFQKLSL